MSTTFDAAFQTKILTLALRDPAFMSRCEGLLLPEYFDFETHAWLVSIANKHFDTYRETVDVNVVIAEVKDAKAIGRIKSEFVDDLKPVLASVFSPAADLTNSGFYVDQVSKFARQRAMETALTDSVDILDKGGDYGEIEKRVAEAQSVGGSEGTASADFFTDVAARISVRTAALAGTTLRGITTGHRELDNLLYHKGWGKKELAILMGAAKSGKSTGLAHFALQAVEHGYKVLYTTHENALAVVLDRMDAAVGSIVMRDLDVSAASVLSSNATLAAKGGMLKVEEFPAGEARVADIEKLLRRYKARGITFDLLVCDYADELKAIDHRLEERFKLKEIYTSLRALCTRWDLAGLTATQTNRGGFSAVTVTAKDVGEDWSKMKIADVVISINSGEEEKKLNQMRLYFALIRNSEGGMTVTCGCDRSRMKFITRILKVA